MEDTEAWSVAEEIKMVDTLRFGFEVTMVDCLGFEFEVGFLLTLASRQILVPGRTLRQVTLSASVFFTSNTLGLVL